ncbi:hypothetical protein [Nostoc sp. DSM 114161]
MNSNVRYAISKVYINSYSEEVRSLFLRRSLDSYFNYVTPNLLP